jgi:hypothetical protein
MMFVDAPGGEGCPAQSSATHGVNVYPAGDTRLGMDAVLFTRTSASSVVVFTVFNVYPTF